VEGKLLERKGCSSHLPAIFAYCRGVESVLSPYGMTTEFRQLERGSDGYLADWQREKAVELLSALNTIISTRITVESAQLDNSFLSASAGQRQKLLIDVVYAISNLIGQLQVSRNNSYIWYSAVLAKQLKIISTKLGEVYKEYGLLGEKEEKLPETGYWLRSYEEDAKLFLAYLAKYRTVAGGKSALLSELISELKQK
jgi:hypothetical protein